jgi:hypothetical protein
MRTRAPPGGADGGGLGTIDAVMAGGYKLRVLLAQALFGKPQGLAAGRAHQQLGPGLHGTRA